MCGCRSNLKATLIFAGVAMLTCMEAKDKRQVGSTVIADEKDRETAETGFSDAVHAGSKYFQYAHVPAKDHYEFGHRRGNDHHFNERHEKAHPHEGEFKTKVRWGDKHGGYGEHYWDYNHAGHDGHGDESQNEEEYAAYEESKQVPVVRQQRSPLRSDDVEFIDDRARSFVESGAGGGRHGGNYRREPSDRKVQRKRHDSYTTAFEAEEFPSEEGETVFKYVKERY